MLALCEAWYPRTCCDETSPHYGEVISSYRVGKTILFSDVYDEAREINDRTLFAC